MNYIINMLARPEKITTTQMAEKNVDRAMEIYLKNSYVSLKSSKINNPDSECILISTFKLTPTWTKRFNDARIRNVIVHFNDKRFTIYNSFAWNIVQYRYEVINYLCKNLNIYDKVIMLDTDTICVDSLRELFCEAEENILLFDVEHKSSNRDRMNILKNYEKIYGQKKYIVHWGGEIICSNISNLKLFLNECIKVMTDAKRCKQSLVNWNDEHITSIAIFNKFRGIVNNANAYLYRYWTKKFYLVSTNFKYNQVSIFHLPDEKTSGMLIVYNKMLNNSKVPSINELSKIFGFVKPKRVFTIYNFYILFMKIKNKLLI